MSVPKWKHKIVHTGHHLHDITFFLLKFFRITALETSSSMFPVRENVLEFQKTMELLFLVYYLKRESSVLFHGNYKSVARS